MVGVWPWRTSSTRVGGGGVGARAMVGANLPSRPWIGPGLGPRQVGTRGRRLPWPARAWSRGASRWPRRSGPRSATRTYWGRPVPGFGDPQPACVSSAWRRPPTAPTAPGGCSPATGRATSSTRRCTGPASPTSRRASTATTACGSTGAWITAPVRCAPPANKPTPAERDTLPAVPRARAGPARRPAGASWCSARSATRSSAGLLGVRPRPPFGHGVEVRARGRPHGSSCSLPRQPAEHLHRQAHRAHARRRVRPGPHPRRPMSQWAVPPSRADLRSKARSNQVEVGSGITKNAMSSPAP